MQVEYMRDFLAVAKAGNISAAAERLYLAQPVLSKHIRSLEKEAGGDLLVRSTHGVALTPLGEEAVKYFSEIVKSYEKFKAIATSQSDNPGLLKIGILSTGFDRYVLPIVTEVKKDYPKANIVYSAEKPNKLMRMLGSGDVDIINGDGSMVGNPNFSSVFLRKEPLKFLVAKGSALAANATVTPDQLSSIPLICLKNNSTTPYMNQMLFESGIHPSRIIPVDELELVPFQVCIVQGFFAFPEFMEARFASESNVTTVAASVPLTENVYCIYDESNTNPLITTYISIAKRFAEKGLFE